jgi:thioredoxin-related protein
MRTALAILAVLALICGAQAAPPAAIYDTAADGAKQIAAVVAVAKREDKKVLVVLGANWCPWCRKLHKVFESEVTVKAVLEDGYVVVYVDVNGNHNRMVDIDLGDLAQNGIPQIVILNKTGEKLLAKDPVEWEKDGGYDVEKVLTFLKGGGAFKAAK